MAQNLNGVTVAILAMDGFEQSELLEPRRALAVCDSAAARRETTARNMGHP
jgi:hypothetical protein